MPIAVHSKATSLRARNGDSLRYSVGAEGLRIAMADGAGGVGSAHVASKAACDGLFDSEAPFRMEGIDEHVANHADGGQTTLLIVALAPNGSLIGSSVGDSLLL